MKIMQIGFIPSNSFNKGWGAVERLIEQYHRIFLAKGIDSFVVAGMVDNIINKVKQKKPDVILCHNDLVFVPLLRAIESSPKLSRVKVYGVSHFPYLKEIVEKVPYEQALSISEHLSRLRAQYGGIKVLRSIVDGLKFDRFTFLCLDSSIDFTKVPSATKNNVIYTQNYLFHDDFLFKSKSSLNRYICVGKIEPRKRQSSLQKVSSIIDFYGPIVDRSFKKNDSYKGEAKNLELAKIYTQYEALVLFSNAELHPLVTIEAMFAGLPLILSKRSSWNYGSDYGVKILSNHNQIKSLDFSGIDRGKIRNAAIQKFSLNLDENQNKLLQLLTETRN
ncbi:glycosyltransferase family 4 protein [Candidatus Methylopumilus universalis]|jgi:glycosyltransferase involved in cell wall biosynthesis|uniref:glycosyltransferase family 4 protein n=1 Tax=Candidatus Methylopumilus universalis TaxID=2588536 RepID=UPI00111F00DB|nr:glycosyltransferase family 4 protein [Candidatus Methylopumilus universalis]QDC79072.1 glycosyltransferase family 4 protein [Candidatus Methylopumilus universalis]